jgi:dipeptidyl aminopeptidase/acylaminoacyl peptidase
MRTLSANAACGATCLACAETGLRTRTRDRQNHAHLEISALTGPGARYMRQTPRLAAAAIAAWPALALAQGAPAPLTAETMWQLKRTGAPAISPDGKLAVYGVTRFDAENDKGDADLYRVATAGGKPERLTSMKGNESEPAWSPDGRYIAFVAKRGEDKQSQLYVIAANGGEAVRVGDVPTGVSAPRWFPDSQRIAFISEVWPDITDWAQTREKLKAREESKLTAMAWDRPPVTHWDHFVEDRVPHLFSVSLDGGQPAAITQASGRSLELREADVDTYDISPDGTEVAFVANTDASGIEENHDVYVVAATGGPARNVTADNPANDELPSYSPDGRWLAYTKQAIKGFYGDTQQLWLIDRKSDARRRVAADWDRSVSGIAWAPDAKSFYASVDDAATGRIYRFDVAKGTPHALTDGSSYSALAVDGKPAVLVALRQSFTEPPTLVAVSTKDGAATKLSDHNDVQLGATAFGKVESVTYKGADGADIQMWVVYPPGFDPAKKYPLYLLLHGGPHNGIQDSWTFRWNAQVFSSWGYVTAWHNFHGSSGFGQAFTDSINPDAITKPYEDTIKAAEWFAAKPWIDAERMAAGGGSYGGFLASVLLGREHPFKTLIAHAAVYDNYTMYGGDYGAEKNRFFEAWERPEEWAKYSPSTSAANFKTPTLVIHGQLDQRVPLNNGMELFHILQNRGVPSRLVYYPDENHWILKRQNSLFWYDETKNWLGRYAPAGGR